MENNTAGTTPLNSPPEAPPVQEPPPPQPPPVQEAPPQAPQPPPAGSWSPPPPGSVPPPGSYPPPNQPYYPPPREPEKKVRRVGVVTMALCLIAVGVLMLVRVLAPNALDFWFIAQLSPVVLVFLGAEMLIASARHRDEKLRFDVLSVFVSLVLIGASLVAAVVPEIFRREVEGNRVGDRLAAELEAGTADLLKQHGELPVYNVEWYVNVEGSHFSDEMTPMDLRPEHYVQVRVFMPGGYKEEQGFARDCRAVLDLLQSQVPHLNYASLYGSMGDGMEYEGDVLFSIWLENRYQMDSDVARLADMTAVKYWQGDTYAFEPAWDDLLNDAPDEDFPEPDAPDDSPDTYAPDASVPAAAAA